MLAEMLRPGGEMGTLPVDAEQIIGLCQPCLTGLLRDNSQPRGQQIRRGPCGKGRVGTIPGRSAQHQASTGQPAPMPVRSTGGRGHTRGGIRAKARKKIQGVRVRLPNRT